MSKAIIDHKTGQVYPIHIQPRLNTKIVNIRPTSTPTNAASASWYDVLLALLAVFLVAVTTALSGVSL